MKQHALAALVVLAAAAAWTPFSSNAQPLREPKVLLLDQSSEELIDAASAKAVLEAIGYDVLGQVVQADRFGVPQRRPRLIMLGIRRDLASFLPAGVARAFDILEQQREEHLSGLGLEAPDERAGEALVVRLGAQRDASAERSLERQRSVHGSFASQSRCRRARQIEHVVRLRLLHPLLTEFHVRLAGDQFRTLLQSAGHRHREAQVEGTRLKAVGQFVPFWKAVASAVARDHGVVAGVVSAASVKVVS